MRQSTALLARRLLGAAPRLLAGEGAGAMPASLAQGAATAAFPVAGALAFARGAALLHSSAPAPADAASSASTSSSSSSGPLNARAECGDVPEGHKDTDLSHHVNNIGLGRRRDLTLRPDVRLHGPTGAGAGQALSTLLKGKRAVIFGVPDMGDVCTNKHVPSFLEQASALRKAGVDTVVCVAHGDPVEVFSWAAAAGADGSAGVSALADRDGSFARMLGVEAPPGAPYSTHRYAALVEDGILLKLKVDDKPGECVKTRGEELLDCARQFFVH